MQHIDLNELYLFAQVVDIGNFSAASRKLNIPKATISRRISNLEKRLGVQLIQRNTHQFFVTNIGQQYYQYCKGMIAEAERAEFVIASHSKEPIGKVRLSCPKDILDNFINPMLVEFLQQYPKVALQVEINEHHVDVLHGGFDFVIRARSEQRFDSELVVRRFCELEQMLVAAPKLIPQPVSTLAELAHYDCLSDSSEGEWLFKNEKKESYPFPYQAKVATKNLNLLRQSLCAGQGIGVMPYFSIKGEIARGELISVLPANWFVDKVIIHAAYPPHRGLLPAVSLLLDFLCERFKQRSD